MGLAGAELKLRTLEGTAGVPAGAKSSCRGEVPVARCQHAKFTARGSH
jgi:hypothetical protein